MTGIEERRAWFRNYRNNVPNILGWQAITGKRPPTQPPTAQEYTKASLPWFDYYAADQKALDGAAALGTLKSLAKLFGLKGESLPDNAPVTPTHVIPLGPESTRRPVREGVF